ncbi:hypothetical protein AB0D46_15590 [Streptomyces sp. NPDC048383]|uniref:hypothetical protein n=1 Tax=Streptomyces sp. NPDC048383 TaxID=3155386 RepID=UPI003436BF95
MGAPRPTHRLNTDTPLETAADAWWRTLNAISRRQHKHRDRTIARLTAIIDSRRRPAELQVVAVYYRAKADRNLGHTDASRTGMQQVADGAGRLARAARR